MKTNFLLLIATVSNVCQLMAADTIRAAWFRTDISPEVGARICGYSPNQVSVEKHDPLYAVGLAMDDGKCKSMIMSLDLVGLDGTMLRDLRHACADAFGASDASVLITCTHNHSGPESARRLNLPDSIDADYVARLKARLLSSVEGLKEKKWTECRVSFISANVDENYNRRFVTGDNCASFTPHRRVLIPLADGPADKELGMMFLWDVERNDSTPGGDAPVFIVGNYAAHVLSTHAPGLGGIRITADYPGFYRDYLRRETGAESMFVQGASGNLVPKGDELGMAAARRTGENLAMATINAIIDVCRNRSRYDVKEPRLGSAIRVFDIPMRSAFCNRIQREYDGDGKMRLEVQLLSVGDLVFVGMPGEAASEIGSMIKWNSPFRKTWIANLATGFAGYISPVNALVQGGYEPLKQPWVARGSLTLVNESVDALFGLRSQVFPEDDKGPDRYPDGLKQPLVRIPAGVKESHFKFAR